ncbi:hypothetical protein Q5P01_008419 [Channa striata]|uniref:Uncharacterized protein n=1 Tax=Channa striata TaxID=64152 RepID=A0AA88SZB7_CHASR|nr:hypothetical protein Q5P01_008419 [Channa striata]
MQVTVIGCEQEEHEVTWWKNKTGLSEGKASVAAEGITNNTSSRAVQTPKANDETCGSGCGVGADCGPERRECESSSARTRFCTQDTGSRENEDQRQLLCNDRRSNFNFNPFGLRFGKRYNGYIYRRAVKRARTNTFSPLVLFPRQLEVPA